MGVLRRHSTYDHHHHIPCPGVVSLNYVSEWMSWPGPGHCSIKLASCFLASGSSCQPANPLCHWSALEFLVLSLADSTCDFDVR